MEKRILELLTRKLAREISPDELAELLELMAEYQDAQHLQDITKEIWNHEMEEVDVATFYQNHRKKYNHDFQPVPDELPEPGSVDRRPFYQKYRSLLVTAACLLAMGTLAYLYFGNPHFKKSEYTEIITGKGVRKSVDLPDGTMVWLNGDSRLSYDPQIQKKARREVNLAGEAYFDVAHNNKRPFIIHTNRFSIRVLGTAFNVSAYPGDKKSVTTLIRGSVELTMNDGAHQTIVLKPKEKIALTNPVKKNTTSTGREDLEPGETLLIQPLTTVRMADQDYIAETSWKDNKLIFENETMEDIGKKLERWYNVQVTVSGEIGKFYFTGAFENETIEEALQAMQLIKSFNFKINRNEIIIN